MKELVFLLEEESAEALLKNLLPRVLHQSIGFRTIAFEGKQDLEKQLVRRLQHYANPHARFPVMRDQDSAPDCKVVKAKLLNLCSASGRAAACLVRIACRELEAMYLADLQAVEHALGIDGLAKRQMKANFRDPDHRLGNPSDELERVTSGRYQKVGSSRLIGLHMDLTHERSGSFKNLLAGIRRLEAELLALDVLGH